MHNNRYNANCSDGLLSTDDASNGSVTFFLLQPRTKPREQATRPLHAAPTPAPSRPTHGYSALEPRTYDGVPPTNVPAADLSWCSNALPPPPSVRPACDAYSRGLPARPASQAHDL